MFHSRQYQFTDLLASYLRMNEKVLERQKRMKFSCFYQTNQFFQATLAWLAVVVLPFGIKAESIDNRFALVLPAETEEAWRAVGWRTNLMEAREVAQKQNRPIFLWIMVGNPQGCT